MKVSRRMFFGALIAAPMVPRERVLSETCVPEPVHTTVHVYQHMTTDAQLELCARYLVDRARMHRR